MSVNVLAGSLSLFNLLFCLCYWFFKHLISYHKTINNSITSFRNNKIKILRKSDNFLIVDKEFDVFTNNEVKGKRSVHTDVASLFPELVDPALQHKFYFPHRLDYATSGVICLALNKTACTAASNSFQDGKSLKFYLALLRGHLSSDFIDIQLPVGQDSSAVASHKMCTSKNKHCTVARKARTCILVLERGIFMRYPATKVIIRPISGRRHQIRVHCSFLGHTIVGDYTYSNKKDIEPERTYLHSYRLHLPNFLEPFDIQTEDPFDSSKLGSQWISVESVNSICGNTFLKLSDSKNCDNVQTTKLLIK